MFHISLLGPTNWWDKLIRGEGEGGGMGSSGGGGGGGGGGGN